LKDLEDLLEIFKQVEEMVEAQGHTIDNIEKDILKTEVNVHYGNMGC
jgi:t-SNARE complex subunit (syntaxin)